MTTDGEVIEGTGIIHTKEGVVITDAAGKGILVEYSRIQSIKEDKPKAMPEAQPAQGPIAEEPKTAEKAAKSPSESKSSQEAPPGHHRHDGFFLRMLGGYGALNLKETPIFTDGTGTGSISGGSSFFGLQLGFAVLDNLILYGSVTGHLALDPTWAVDGVKLVPLTSTSVGINVYGAGVSYYFDAINAYVSGSAGAARATFTADKTAYSSERGFGMDLQIGKEWWVSANWGLGAAFFFHYSRMDDVGSGNIIPKITNTVVGLAFSATFN